MNRRKKPETVTFNRARLEQHLAADLSKYGPILLCEGAGHIPYHGRGLIPETILDVLKLIEDRDAHKKQAK